MNTLLVLILTFLKIGAISFGGGYAVISMIQHEVVYVNNWVSATDFINIVGISGLTPGPIAINASIFVGYKIAGITGALLSTAAVITVPCFLSLLATLFLERFQHLNWVNSVLCGIKPALIGLIAVALFTITKTSVNDIKDLIIGALVAILLFKTKISPVFLLIGAGLVGIIFF